MFEQGEGGGEVRRERCLSRGEGVEKREKGEVFEQGEGREEGGV